MSLCLPWHHDLANALGCSRIDLDNCHSGRCIKNEVSYTSLKLQPVRKEI